MAFISMFLESHYKIQLKVAIFITIARAGRRSNQGSGTLRLCCGELTLVCEDASLFSWLVSPFAISVAATPLLKHGSNGKLADVDDPRLANAC